MLLLLLLPSVVGIANNNVLSVVWSSNCLLTLFQISILICLKFCILIPKLFLCFSLLFWLYLRQSPLQVAIQHMRGITELAAAAHVVAHQCSLFI